MSGRRERVSDEGLFWEGAVAPFCWPQQNGRRV